jgi:hypothetical protein
MGIKITSVDHAIKSNGLKVIVHGGAGSGKTTMAGTTGVKTLIISAESGLLSLAGAPDYIHVTEVKTMAQLDEVYDFLRAGNHGYQWAILDSISEIGEVVLSSEEKAEQRSTCSIRQHDRCHDGFAEKIPQSADEHHDDV